MGWSWGRMRHHCSESPLTPFIGAAYTPPVSRPVRKGFRRMVFSPLLRPAVAHTGIRWEEPDCPLCGGERRSPILEAPDPTPGGPGLRFAVVRCDECGLHFTSPPPDPATIGRFYPPSYPPHRRPRARDRSA